MKGNWLWSSPGMEVPNRTCGLLKLNPPEWQPSAVSQAASAWVGFALALVPSSLSPTTDLIKLNAAKGATAWRLESTSAKQWHHHSTATRVGLEEAGKVGVDGNDGIARIGSRSLTSFGVDSHNFGTIGGTAEKLETRFLEKMVK